MVATETSSEIGVMLKNMVAQNDVKRQCAEWWF